MTSPWRTSLLSLAALAVAGCNTASLPGVGGLNGVNTVAVVRVAGLDGGVPVNAQYGQIAWVTSSNSDDLKGLELILTDPSLTRSYVPAPNPLQPLSIPTVNQPVELATSLRYASIGTTLPIFGSGFIDGQVRTGPLLFVRGAASPNISVVGAADVPESLRQLTNGLLQQSAGLVTAISARLTANETEVVLYYATFDGQDATVWEQVLQSPPTQSPTFTGPFPTSLTLVPDCSVRPQFSPQLLTLFTCPPRPVRTYQEASVSALQVLPTLPSDPPLPAFGGLEGGRLAVALRELVPPLNDPSLSNAGEVRIIDPAVPADLDANGTSSDPFFRIARYFAPFNNPQPPLIPGAPPQPPVRALTTHPRAYDIVADGGTPAGGAPAVLVNEGARLWAVVDESSCFGSPNCTGLLAIDSSPYLTDGGPNANYGLLAFDGSDCLTFDATFGFFYCANEVGTVNRMLALRPGVGGPGVGVPGFAIPAAGVIQGLAFESTVAFANATTGLLGVVPLLGTVTISAESLDHTAAQIFFVDGVSLRPINESPGAGITNGITLNVPGGIQFTVDGGGAGAINFIDAEVGVGLYPFTETITIISQGPIPGLSLIAGIPSDGGVLGDGGAAQVLVWPVPDAGAVYAANALEVNDFLTPVNLSGTLCLVQLGNVLVTPSALVTAIDSTGATIITGPLSSGFEALPLNQNLLQACPGASGFIATAGPDSVNPFLVEGSTSGLLGRMQSDQQPPLDGGPQFIGATFQVPNAITQALGFTYPRFYNPDVPPGTLISGETITPPGSDAGVQVLPLTLHMPPPDAEFAGPTATAQAFYSFILSSGVAPASLPIDSVDLGFAGLFLPGGVAQTRVIDVNGEFVLDIIAYPSSNTVVDFDPTAILPNFPNSGPINVHF
jgi:hypothetical protein